MDGKISYAIQSGNDAGVFAISSDGNITTTAALDRETTSQYTLTVTATDQSATSPKSSSTTIVVTILDVNDNPPRFTTAEREFVVQETSVVGEIVVRLPTTDDDVGLNGEVEYSIVASNETSDLFRFDSSNGTFTVNSKSSKGIFSQYT